LDTEKGAINGGSPPFSLLLEMLFRMSVAGVSFAKPKLKA